VYSEKRRYQNNACISRNADRSVVRIKAIFIEIGEVDIVEVDKEDDNALGNSLKAPKNKIGVIEDGTFLPHNIKLG